jgi:disulfide bond formation protein DsbB
MIKTVFKKLLQRDSMSIEGKISPTIVFLCFLVASVATLGSLFFSEIMEFVPCTMCWYQRIFMYPLVIIFLIHLLYPDEKLFKYSIGIVAVGLIFALYHNLLMFGIIPESSVPCTSGVPCSTEYINWFGFINIPLLSLVSYLILFLLLIIGKKRAK